MGSAGRSLGNASSPLPAAPLRRCPPPQWRQHPQRPWQAQLRAPRSPPRQAARRAGGWLRWWGGPPCAPCRPRTRSVLAVRARAWGRLGRTSSPGPKAARSHGGPLMQRRVSRNTQDTHLRLQEVRPPSLDCQRARVPTWLPPTTLMSVSVAAQLSLPLSPTSGATSGGGTGDGRGAASSAWPAAATSANTWCGASLLAYGQDTTTRSAASRKLCTTSYEDSGAGKAGLDD
jgi:hypothetical protein